MRNYLSFGGGVNSVAMMLLLLDEGVEFEAVYVDHGGDWPETREYITMLQKNYPITILKPNVAGFDDLYNYLWHYKTQASRLHRWCTDKFKVTPMLKYYETPAFVMLGIDYGEQHRARLGSKGFENRYPLIEREITRKRCVQIIKEHGLSVPIKSGCYFCPFQRVDQLRKLRKNHPELFCKLVNLEQSANDRRIGKNLLPHYPWRKPVKEIVNEPDTFLFEELSYPPCQCGL